MKLLWVKAGGVIPLDTGGKIRSYQILKELARKHQVTLYSYYAEHPNDVHHTLERLFARVICRPLKLATPRGFAAYVNYARRFLSAYPYSMNRYYRPEIAAEIHSLTQSEGFDAIVCDFLVPARVIPWETPCPKLLFTHNVEATIYRRQYETTENLLLKLAAWREYRRTERAEHRYLGQADHVLTVSDTDRDVFARVVDPSRITTVPTGVDLDYFQPGNEACQPDTLVFTGSMDYAANEDAMLFFVDEILPRVRSQVPNVSLVIVGRRPSRKVQALAASGQNIQVTGTVDDVRPYIQKGTVYIVPLRIGSGTRLKIFEAMAMAKAIVSTSVGAEGLPVREGVNILIANSPVEFARRVIGLLQHPVELSKLGKAARHLVEQEYGWPTIAIHFESVLRRLTEGRSVPSTNDGRP
jgi:sugar transferase (PEP-CTERM/EpsH1 system associated)